MNIIESIFLGVIQGLTEFLPISSTGHLTLAGKLMKLISDTHPEQWTAFIAVIQLGTMIAVFVYFWNDLISIVKDFIWQSLIKRKSFAEQNINSKLGWYLIIGTIPVVIVGLGFKNIIEGAITKNLFVISSSLIVLAIFLAAAEKISSFNKKIENIKWYDALLIGIAQCLALIPGSSRSGTTITAALLLGFERETAAKFSFLLSLPAVLGSGLLELYESLKFIDSSITINLILATIISAAVGYLSIEFLLKYLRKHTTYVFVYYRITIGLLILALILFGVITK
ncbi:undecaprenyl-diphosphatase UppP [Melioribacteraceae bacterium 4301-Me]|uniref:undecaprenyl-diphosphatase UppP n=1 Tax=Pyranulibacter aquaticus TaxID=3163344 RepID=UPI00359806AB